MVASCTGFISPLDLKCILINYLAGNPLIFVGIAAIVITILAAKFKMTNQVSLMIFAIFIIMMTGISVMTSSMIGFFFLLVLVAGIIGGYIIIKLFKF